MDLQSCVIGGFLLLPVKKFKGNKLKGPKSGTCYWRISITLGFDKARISCILLLFKDFVFVHLSIYPSECLFICASVHLSLSLPNQSLIQYEQPLPVQAGSKVFCHAMRNFCSEETIYNILGASMQ